MTHVIGIGGRPIYPGTSEPITPACGATCDIGIANIASFVNVVNFVMDDWFYQLDATLTPVEMERQRY